MAAFKLEEGHGNICWWEFTVYKTTKLFELDSVRTDATIIAEYAREEANDGQSTANLIDNVIDRIFPLYESTRAGGTGWSSRTILSAPLCLDLFLQPLQEQGWWWRRWWGRIGIRRRRRSNRGRGGVKHSHLLLIFSHLLLKVCLCLCMFFVLYLNHSYNECHTLSLSLSLVSQRVVYLHNCNFCMYIHNCIKSSNFKPIPSQIQ